MKRPTLTQADVSFRRTQDVSEGSGPHEAPPLPPCWVSLAQALPTNTALAGGVSFVRGALGTTRVVYRGRLSGRLRTELEAFNQAPVMLPSPDTSREGGQTHRRNASAGSGGLGGAGGDGGSGSHPALPATAGSACRRGECISRCTALALQDGGARWLLLVER